MSNVGKNNRIRLRRGSCMRDINDYTNRYLVQDFEMYQVKYRRMKVIEQIDEFGPKRIIKIVCGMEPLFQFVKGKEWVIVEPSEILCNMAVENVEQYFKSMFRKNGRSY